MQNKLFVNKYIVLFGAFLFVIAFVLPSLVKTGQSILGYSCFTFIFESLFSTDGGSSFLWALFLNFGNIGFVILMIAFMLRSDRKVAWTIVGGIAIASAWYYQFDTEFSDDLAIGYWFWCAGITIVSVFTVRATILRSRISS